ncbi:ankyrin repeat domain-containing protein [uncultured Sphingomonas sp.]|uniref:ankyrin repeat domain-containing protein n=1 Tax=uncultured Sphingomonas sp. TaxID=158754 RepID=UPI0035CAAE19
MTNRAFLPAVLALALAGTAASAQFQSDGYKFLDAVRNGKNDDVTSMVEKPGSRIVDTRDRSTGEGALHIVVRRSDRAYLNYLLVHGADPNLRDDKGNSPLLLAVTMGQEAMIQPLLTARADPNLANSSGETPLIRAVQRHDMQMARELIAGGANPDQRDVIAGLSAREYAARDTRSPELSKLLNETPAKPKAAVAGPKL